MTYGRVRLWLGITGVGSFVMIAATALATGLPQSLLESNKSLGVRAFVELTAVTGFFMLWLMPLDFLGGFLLPNKFQKSRQAIADWLRSYVVAALFQAMLYVLFGSLILLLSQFYGRVGEGVAISLFTIACFVIRNRLILNREAKSETLAEKLLDAITMIRSWQILVPRTVVVDHKDIGFTGGVVGFGKNVKIVIPKAWLTFTTEQLAMVIARRAFAVSSGSYMRGLILAFVWNLAGFLLCSFLPGAGLTTVAGFVTTLCGFIALVALIWLSTAFIQVPCHEKLVQGFDPSA